MGQGTVAPHIWKRGLLALSGAAQTTDQLFCSRNEWQKQIWTFFWKVIDMALKVKVILRWFRCYHSFYMMQPSFALSVISLGDTNIPLQTLLRIKFLTNFFLLASLKCLNVKQSSRWMKMIVEVVLVLLLYLSFSLADRLVLQSPEDTKCQSQAQTRISDRTSYYCWPEKQKFLHCFTSRKQIGKNYLKMFLVGLTVSSKN